MHYEDRIATWVRDMTIEFDDDKSRIDVAAIHAFLSTQADWAIVVGVYDGGEQIGFCRCVTDRVSFAYLADVYVLPAYRGRWIGRAAGAVHGRGRARHGLPMAAAHPRHACALSQGGFRRAERAGDGTPAGGVS
jgi:GNAT superfamily N-acetyltransferase